MSIYILRHTKDIVLWNDQIIDSYALEIGKSIRYFIDIYKVNQLSVLAFEEGALLTLYSLSYLFKLEDLSSLSKVVLINPFNPRIKVYGSSPTTFLNKIKRNII
eukprot:GHVR01002412.1.p1 GENE.GHVR01002412.1~~GHVR01002412.1.p1  ORF type:complete len:104 (-),score=4.59 GHVR01002412.1:2292-2603(-)